MRKPVSELSEGLLQRFSPYCFNVGTPDDLPPGEDLGDPLQILNRTLIVGELPGSHRSIGPTDENAATIWAEGVGSNWRGILEGGRGQQPGVCIPKLSSIFVD